MKRMNLSLLFSIFLLAGILGGALGCTQDPYAKQPDYVRFGTKPNQVTPTPAQKVVPEDALRIDAQDFYTFVEETAGEAIVSGRVLLAGVSYAVSIENMADFPGATYDVATGKFSWTPPRMFVTGVNHMQNMHLDVSLTTSGDTVLKHTRQIPVYVQRSDGAPQVLNIDDLLTVPTREGTTRKFTVTVRDPDSLNTADGKPRLMIVSAGGSNSLASSVSVYQAGWGNNPVQDTVDPTKWVFTLILNLNKADLTTGIDRFSFSVVVASRFGVNSAPVTASAAVITEIRDPQITWTSPMDVFAGQENNITFTAFDPKRVGKVSLNWTSRCDQLPGSAACVCKQDYNSSWLQHCAVKWKLPLDMPKSKYDIEFDVLNQSPVLTDSLFAKVSFKGRVNVIAPPPTPIPAPTATPVPPTPTPDPSATPAPEVSFLRHLLIGVQS